MAWTEFYLTGAAGASDLNAGSTTADAASVTSTNGDWDNASAARFTAAGGATPFTGVSVGEYASIYLDAATSAVFVSKITAVDPGGTYIEVSKTANKLGTAPAAGATGRSCKVGGAWKTAAIITSLMGTQTIDQPTRMNHKLGTYASTTTARNIAISGTAANPFWWRGYNATPGDLSEDNTNAPTFTFTTAALTLTTTFSHFTNVKVSGAQVTASSGQLILAGSGGHLYRVDVTNTATGNANGTAVNNSNGTWVIERCNFQADAAANYVLRHALHIIPTLIDCVLKGAINGITSLGGGGTLGLIGTVIRDTAGDAINISANLTRLVMDHSTLRNIGGDGVEWTGTIGVNSHIRNCVFAIIGGYGLRNSSGTNCDFTRSGNDYYSCTSGTESGFGDSPAYNALTDASDPTTSSTNMTPVAGSQARGGTNPVQFEGETYSTYRDRGAVQHQDVGGNSVIGSGIIVPMGVS